VVTSRRATAQRDERAFKEEEVSLKEDFCTWLLKDPESREIAWCCTWAENLSTEAKRRKFLEAFEILKLARRVLLSQHLVIFGHDALTVVDHLNKLLPAIFEAYL